MPYNYNSSGVILTPMWRDRLARFMAHDWNSCMGNTIEGSNPSLSAKKNPLKQCV